MNNSAVLARRITWSSSKQSFLTAWFLADRDLVDDCLRAYAYFRWADDIIDLSLSDQEARRDFIERQKSLIERLYNWQLPDDLTAEESMLADLIAHDRGGNTGLQSFIRNFMAVLDFDAQRKGRLISNDELRRYTELLATAVMDGIQYFIGNCYAYPKPDMRCQAVIGAHITHMLRDTLDDLSAGYINIPKEYLEAHGIEVYIMNEDQLCEWVRERVQLARACFSAGKRYIGSLKVLRCKLAGYWYCARFEHVLDAIERDGYILQPHHGGRHGLAAWISMARVGGEVILKHLTGWSGWGMPQINPSATPSSRISERSIRIE